MKYYFFPFTKRVINIPEKFLEIQSIIVTKFHELIEIEKQKNQKRYKEDFNQFIAGQKKVYCPTSLSIVVTNSCNLNCTYCYSKIERKNDMISIDKAKTAINFLIENAKLKSQKEIEVEFIGGGEPTLGFETIREIINYAKEKSIPESITSNFYLITNGYFNPELRDEIFNLFKSIQFSIDGFQSQQIIQRINGAKINDPLLVYKNIQNFTNRNASKVKINTVVTNSNLNILVDLCEYYHKELGCTNIRFELMKDTSISKTVKYNYQSILENFKKVLKYAKTNNIQIKVSGPDIDKTGFVYCGTHSGEPMFLTPDGIIKACIEPVYNKTQSDLLIGEIKDKVSVDTKKVEFLTKRNVFTVNDCKVCEIRFNCKGQCSKYYYERNGNYTSINDPEKCDYNRQILKEMIVNKLE